MINESRASCPPLHMSTTASIYHIAPAYRKLTIWRANPATGRRQGVATCTPSKGLTREQRYNVLADRLAEEGFVRPLYSPKGDV